MKLVDKTQRQRSVFQVINDVRQKAQSIKNASFQFTTTSFIGGGYGAALQVQLSGPDENTLIDLVEPDRRRSCSGVPGVADVRNTDAEQSPELQAQLDRARMNDLGITATEVGNALRTAVAGTQVSHAAAPWAGRTSTSR